MLLSPHTIRSGRSGPSRAVSRWLAVPSGDGCAWKPGWTSATVTCPAGCDQGGERERQRARSGRDGRRHRAHRPQRGPRRGDQDHDAGVRRHQGEADQPDTADDGQREHRRVLPLARAEQRPRAAERLPGPDPLDQQPVARHHHQRRQAAPERHRRPQQRPGAHPDPGPQGAEDDGHQQQGRADVGDQPVVRGHDEPGAEPPGTDRGLARRGRRAHQQQAGHQHEPRQEARGWARGRRAPAAPRPRAPRTRTGWARALPSRRQKDMPPFCCRGRGRRARARSRLRRRRRYGATGGPHAATGAAPPGPSRTPPSRTRRW